MDTTPEPVRRLGHYEIQTKLGSGGMGHVYQALDTKLNRMVALKILRSDTPGRIVREAQAASALNHPNIVTVYEIGRENDIDFIAMELVDGETLARLVEKHLSSHTALRYAIQIADALGAAHAAGIVHRDLKPGNIMVTEAGAVKVLDFGIAKMTGIANRESAVTETITQTIRVAGTFAYMSPEQAEGKEVDGRSDVFAFGCVLYEMFTGRRAFSEDSSMRTLAAVMAKEHTPARELFPGLPRPLEGIIENCLRKRRQERWQSMTDVKILLEGALADLDAVPPPPAASRKRRVIAFALLPVAAAAGAVLAWVYLRPAPAVPALNRALRRVTTSAGLSASPALSRDGNLLAFASDRAEAGNLDLWLQQIPSRDPIRLTTDPADDTDPAISPDNARIIFRSEANGGGIYTVPVLGGEPVVVVPRGRNPRFSPDGRWIAYWEGHESRDVLKGSARVWVMEAGGGEPRQLGADLGAALYPVWAPDSQSVIAVGRANTDADPDWWVLPVSGAHAVKRPTLADFDKQGLGRVAWLRRPVPLEWRSTGVLFTAGPGDSGNLWELPMPSGAAVPVTHGPGYHMHASASPGGRLAFSDLEWKHDVWSLRVDADRGVVRGPLERLTPDEPDAAAPSLSADGARLVFRASELGRSLVRVRDLATGKQISLVDSLKRIRNPRFGGGVIAYSDDEGTLVTVPSTGGPGTQLCKRCGTMMGISSDGLRVSYEPYKAEHLMFFDIPRKAVVTVALRPADGVITAGKFSPDGRWMAFHVGTIQSTTYVFIVPIDGALPVPRDRWIAITDGASEDVEPAWSPNGNLLYFLSDRDGFRCIWARALNPATKLPSADAFEVAHFHTARRSLKRVLGTTGSNGLSAAPGRLVFSFGELTGNIWLEEKR